MAAFGAFLAFLDSTIVNIAFPDIQKSFPSYDLGSLSWILNAYNIVFAAFLVAAAGWPICWAAEEHSRSEW
ncbi:putative antibiotic antiporter [Mycobacterium ulcerans str. Harvey]|uniref:Antibiotic antiporter n=1 Tax=Mycobacterium ulcerans str. Harvey TaxID=1299332 RepID=A0ABN0R8M9_MYCUL|nr:putative antibiotic antiporter [Mycobacterium ulcerans str. Harvey]